MRWQRIHRTPEGCRWTRHATQLRQRLWLHHPYDRHRRALRGRTRIGKDRADLDHMIVIILIALLSSLSLRKMLKQKGHSENRIWLKPMREALFFVLIMNGISFGLSFLLSGNLPPAITMIVSASSAGSVFITLICVALYCSRLSGA